ncbi:MAG: hypothetical protein K0R62_8512, partial [Nonomuraea muscovyensis]|nr:hypothetical protein [Nonomuraea muscovyensis]
MTQSGDTFPMIDDVYPEHGMLLGSVTPLLTVEVSRLGVPPLINKGLEFTFTICSKVEPDPDAGPFDPVPTPVCVNSPGQVWGDTWRVPAGKLEWGKQYEWWVRVVDLDSG